MTQAAPMPTSMTVQMTARGVGPSHMAASMATPGMPQSPTSVRQLPDQSMASLSGSEALGLLISPLHSNTTERP
ncbi:MAG: hypothetical protein A3E77_02030 [Sphingopyxis sp. RIFCSPHIGHO2_12_FULL_65_19]|nr:MAG: hypothetical protein A3E77_02030 [Sphingopyxis sp. RIFCSPHIGHO2_12_FULL_65_19]